MHHQHHHKIFRTKSSLSCAFDADVSVDKHESAARRQVSWVSSSGLSIVGKLCFEASFYAMQCDIAELNWLDNSAS